MNEKILKAYASAPKTWIWKILAAFGIACLLAWSGSAVRVSNPTGNGLEVAGNILSGIFHPSAKLLFTLGTDGVPYLLLETFCIAFLGTIVGAVISLPLSFLSASNLVPKGVAFIGRVLIAAIRTIPAFVYGLMFIRVTGPGPFAGLLTMSLCSIGMVSKMFIESIEDLDKRILESLDAAGCTTFQKIRYGILPQLTADFTSTIIYRFDMNLRDATVLGLVGAGGIGMVLWELIRSFAFEQTCAVMALIVLVVGAAVISPLGPAAAPQAPYDTGAAVQGFLTGYQTMDLLASLAFGIIIAETIHELGVTDDKRVAFEISRSGVIAGVLMAIIYCGLGLAGMQLGTVMPDVTNGAAILARSASMHFGLVGTVVVFAIFFLACMNVCIGLISCCSRYFCETYVVEGGAEASEEAMRRPFAVLAFVFAAFSCVLSNVGLDVILMFSVPMLNALYPVAIVLVLMGLVHGFCDAHPQVWVWVGGVVAVQSVITSVRDAFFVGTWLPFDALPLADIGAAWAPVAVVAFVIGLLHSQFVAHSRS